MLTVCLVVGMALVVALVLSGLGYGNFQAGHLVPVTFQPQGGQNFVVNIKEQDFALQVLLHDVTGFKALGVRARIAGPLDITGRMVCDFDTDEPPYGNPPLIVPGVRGIAVFGVSPIKGIQLPLICEKLHFSGSTDKEMMWDADWRANSLAGIVVYPPL
jgi:hypothetical protein